ncbi:hypothetical protein [Abyssalbus ytuae]|uniref:Carboxypeptidase-like regulatory domain-containing protein n=1 Tax=Abyssalbus ytuae TaxID=2926907 RepID=A0A9E7A234_9FLAO|nr:hypothetical protein [Abyssalbus ytuae]UOB18351.1 hypothetical protein MQE35_03455 [Abyssalbus ytuae]
MFGQQPGKELKGQVVSDSLDVEGVYILNQNTNTAAVTTKEGYFLIEVNVNDTLFISAIQFIPKKIMVTNKMMDKGMVVISLEEKVTYLDKVVLTPYNLSGNLEKDVRDADIKPDINFYDVGIPGFKGIRKEKIVPLGEALNYGLITQIKLEALYKHISGYYKNLKTRRQWDEENKAVTRILNYFGHDFFINSYNLPKDDVYVFVLSCVVSTEIESYFYNQEYDLVIKTFEEVYNNLNEE